VRLAGERGRCYDLPSIRRDTHRARAVGTALLVLTVTAPSTSPAAGLAVPLAIEETAGVARRSWPVTASVPFPRGRLRGADVWVAAPAGDATLAQARALERWPDGSTRWLLVDFLADAGSPTCCTTGRRHTRPVAGFATGTRRRAACSTRARSA